MNTMNFHTIQPLWSALDGRETQPLAEERDRGTLFADIFQSAIDNVKQTETVKNDAEYRLATGQLDNPAELTIASAQWSTSVELLVQLRNRALDAYNELIRLSV